MRRLIQTTSNIDQEAYSEEAWHPSLPRTDSLESVKSSPIEKVAEFEDYLESRKEWNIVLEYRAARSPAFAFRISITQNGKRVNVVKMFSIKKFGLEEAFDLAAKEKRRFLMRLANIT